MTFSLNKTIISFVLFIALLGGIRLYLGLPNVIVILTEILIYTLFVISLFSRKIKGLYFPHLIFSLFIMIMIGLCSISLNETSYHRMIFSIRLLYRFYFFYIAITLLDLSDDSLKFLNKILFIYLILQFPVVAIKFIKYGIAERTMGAYSTPDGSLSTTIPITVIFFMASFYRFHKKSIIYLLVGLVYIIISIVGAKRAVLYLFPIQFVFIYYYFYFKGFEIDWTKKISIFVFFLIFILILSSSVVYLNRSLNPEEEVGGSINYKYALNYTKDYMDGVDGYGYSYGRTTTTIRVFEILSKKGIINIFLGLGPGSRTKSFFDTKKDIKKQIELKDEIMISYGMTAFTRIAFEYGVLGVIAYLYIILNLTMMAIKYSKQEDDPYWKAFAYGSVGFSFSMLFFFFAYNTSSVWGDTYPALYFYVMAVIYTRKNRHSKYYGGLETFPRINPIS
ncbi:hypothetical protein [Desulfosarcina variabilis]|uniref:hypothetical protein n=1 Tax=Desulfosarcina variabilis TaxID=2300 RepID=UPI003AFA9AC1